MIKIETKSLNLKSQAPQAQVDERFHIHILYFVKAKDREKERDLV